MLFLEITKYGTIILSFLTFIRNWECRGQCPLLGARGRPSPLFYLAGHRPENRVMSGYQIFPIDTNLPKCYNKLVPFNGKMYL